jgi:hypothetical protein
LWASWKNKRCLSHLLTIFSFCKNVLGDSFIDQMLLSALEFAQGEPTLVGKYLTPNYLTSKNSLDVNKPGSSTERKNFGIPKELKVVPSMASIKAGVVFSFDGCN